jgi:hypothetical protein
MKGRKTGGRQKGTPNKLTANLKTAILGAFDEAGGKAYLVTVAKDQPAVFCTLLGKVLPTQLTGPGDGPLQTRVDVYVPDNGRADRD